LRTSKEISSTERLIDLISSDDSVVDESPNSLSPAAYPKTRKRLFSRKLLLKKNITVGVDFGHEDLKLAMAKKTSDQQ